MSEMPRQIFSWLPDFAILSEATLGGLALVLNQLFCIRRNSA